MNTNKHQQKYCLITRPREEGEELKVRLESYKIPCLLEPLIDIEIQRFLLPKDIQTVIFTSQNGIKSYIQNHGNLSVRALIIGGKSTNLAKTLGIKDAINCGQDVSEMLAFIKKNYTPAVLGIIVYISGNIITEDLPSILGEEGYNIQRVVGYLSFYHEEISKDLAKHLRLKDILVIPFFSLKAAETFIVLVQKAGFQEVCAEIKAVAISERVSEALKKIYWKEVLISDKKDEASIIETIRGAFYYD